MLTAIGLVNRKGQILTPSTPKPIDKNLSQVITSATPYVCAKFGTNPSTGRGFCANGRNITKTRMWANAQRDGRPVEYRPNTGSVFYSLF